MLQIACLARTTLGDSTDLIANFVAGQHCEDGGYADRVGKSDLYYTVFAMNCLQAVGAEVPWAKIRAYLESFGDGEDLDFVHLCSLVRCWCMLPPEERSPAVATLLQRAEAYRAQDGGYHNFHKDHPNGSAYGCFFALGAYQDSEIAIPDMDGLLRSVAALQTDDGAYANDHEIPLGATPATAGAVTVLCDVKQAVDPRTGEWLQQRIYPEGGFFALANAPVPDLLSTATALHALGLLQKPLPGPVVELCLDFVDTLWSSQGAFYGHWADDILDVEYTYYGLLALGHLSLLS